MHLYGLYENKLYFSDSQGLAYIDISSSSPTRIAWIDFPKLNDYFAYKIGGGVILNDKLYFNYRLNWNNDEKNDGLLCLSLSATSMDQAVQLDSSISRWIFDKHDNTFICLITGKDKYYQHICKYDASTNTKTLLIEDVGMYFRYLDDNGIILYSPLNEFKVNMYNLKTKQDKTIIPNTSVGNKHGNPICSIEYFDNDFYYINQDKIVKHNNGKNDVIFTIPEYFGRFTFKHIDENTIVINHYDNPPQYIVNGELKNELPDNYMISVKISDDLTVKYAQNEIYGFRWSFN